MNKLEDIKINKIKLSLLKKDGEVDPSTNLCTYKKIKTGTLNFSLLEELNNENILLLTEAMYTDISDENLEWDSIGIWIEVEGSDLPIENSIEKGSLKNIKRFGREGINPFIEFIKMTLYVE